MYEDLWLPLSTISNSGTQLTYNFMKAFQSWLGTKVKLSIASHTQKDALEK